MKKIVSILLVFLFLASFSLAQTSGGNIWWPVDDGVGEDLSMFVEMYNQNIEKVPGFVKSMFSDERLNIHIEMKDGTEIVVGLRTEEAIIVETVEVFDEPTMLIFTSEEAVNQIAEAENPGEELRAALDDGRVEVKGVTFGNKIKLGLMNIVMMVWGWFS